MPTGARVRSNSVFGTVADNPLTSVSTTLTSNQLVLLPTINAGSNHAVITLDPLRQFGDPEIVVVTAHTPASTIATIVRGTYGTGAREHPFGTVWTHAALDEDFTEILTSGTRPGDPYRGQEIFETDTNRYVARSTADVWQQKGLFFDPPACRVFHNAAQSYSSTASSTASAFNSERYDTDSMHNTVTNNSRITFNTAGIYVVEGSGVFDPNTTGARFIGIKLNGISFISAILTSAAGTGGFGGHVETSTTYKFNVSDFVELFFAQTSGGPLNLLTQGNYSPEFSATWIGRGN